MCSVACRSLEEFNRVRELVNAENTYILSKTSSSRHSGSNVGAGADNGVGDPVKVRTKRCGPSVSVRGESSKKPRRCTNFREEGHNRRKCPDSQGTQTATSPNVGDSDDEADYHDGEDVNVDGESDSEQKEKPLQDSVSNVAEFVMDD